MPVVHPVPDDASAVGHPLVEAAMKRSGVVWLQAPPGSAPRLVWYVWHGGAVYLVHGGAEQPLPGLRTAADAVVTAKSKDTGGRVVRWSGVVEHVLPGSPLWDEVVPQLHAARLNPRDGEEQPARWARESMLTRIRPSGEVTGEPAEADRGSGAAVPRPSGGGSGTPRPSWRGRRRPRRPLA